MRGRDSITSGSIAWITAVNVFVAEAGGLVPRVTAAMAGPPNFHRDGPLGHHDPALIDLKDAETATRGAEEVEFWPQCPQYWKCRTSADRTSGTRAKRISRPIRQAG